MCALFVSENLRAGAVKGLMASAVIALRVRSLTFFTRPMRLTECVKIWLLTNSSYKVSRIN